jgi:pimeloyl-ACP methyl ester carboxylesterase
MAARPDRNSALSDAACPVLLVAGEHDRIINPDKISSAQNERLQRTMLPDVGHMSMMEAPERLAQTLLSFLPK